MTAPALLPRVARLAALEDAGLMAELLAAALETAAAERRTCEARVAQLSGQEAQRVVGAYPAGEAWRWCAPDYLQRLIDALSVLEARANARGAASGVSPARSADHRPQQPAAGVQPVLPLGPGPHVDGGDA